MDRFWQLNKVTRVSQKKNKATRVVHTWRCGIGQVLLLGSCPFYEKTEVIIWILFSGSVRRDRFVCYPQVMGLWVPKTDTETWTYWGVTWCLGYRDFQGFKAT